MNLLSSDFEIFGLPERFDVARGELDARWKALQQTAHPDRHASADAQSQRQAMQWSVRINEAYQRLKDPVQRAAYLCERRGAAIDAERNTAMPGDFLMQQLAWREALDEANDAGSLERLADEVSTARRGRLLALQQALDINDDAPEAARQVRALMFIERFAQDVEDRLDQLGQ
ncbi:MAG: Fe-S protein assembly co-chaperone HscB [Hydrogenophaga sp.]|uniref:Fe-S protein assembly co-chaperone HscB n=1 Tax=Hydrogenophaga sp. TaxID=1904254 RepID=UPI001DAE8A09|nr:Fe-S protein assembly co-chaperone HscB [Hydrogenophaga sp.]MBX3609776.1 Fe-S protein assembly co-chaperone HscB [Hydrogenophaga sp.]